MDRDVPPEPLDEIALDLAAGLAPCFAFDLAALEHLLARHAAFDAYCREHLDP